MGFFKKSEPKEIGEEIADKIMQQQDRLGTLFSILNRLPEDLVDWFKGVLKSNSSTQGYVEVDFAIGVNLGPDILPGDLVIRKNRDPKVGDIVEIGIRDEDGYTTQAVKVLKINLKDGTLFVQNILSSDSKGSIAINNIILVIDKVIKYGDPDWKKITQILEIDYDLDEIMRWVQGSIEHVKEANFHNKENTLKRLEDRLKILKKK